MLHHFSKFLSTVSCNLCKHKGTNIYCQPVNIFVVEKRQGPLPKLETCEYVKNAKTISPLLIFDLHQEHCTCGLR